MTACDRSPSHVPPLSWVLRGHCKGHPGPGAQLNGAIAKVPPQSPAWADDMKGSPAGLLGGLTSPPTVTSLLPSLIRAGS